MVTRRWTPFGELRQMQDTMNRLWPCFGPGYADGGPEMESWAIPLDVYRQGDNFYVVASVPGVNPDHIEISIEDNVLTIKAQTEPVFQSEEGKYLLHERRWGTFHRALRMPDTVDFDRAETSYFNGVLTITLPKMEAKRARYLKVGAGHQEALVNGNS